MTNADRRTNPYAPPAEVTAIPTGGEVCCPWCQRPIRFMSVYLSLGSKVQCPNCSQTSVRRKHGLPEHLSESLLMFMFVATVIAIYWFAGAKFVFTSILLMYPFFGLADYLIDRRRLYLAKPHDTVFS